MHHIKEHARPRFFTSPDSLPHARGGVGLVSSLEWGRQAGHMIHKASTWPMIIITCQ